MTASHQWGVSDSGGILLNNSPIVGIQLAFNQFGDLFQWMPDFREGFEG
jgi:hypothetical protein